MIVYDNVLGKLKEHGYSTVILRNEKLLSQSTITRIRNGEPITTESIDVICGLTGLQPGEFLKYK